MKEEMKYCNSSCPRAYLEYVGNKELEKVLLEADLFRNIMPQKVQFTAKSIEISLLVANEN